MKIALLGFGNMGKEISRIVAEQKKDIIVSVSYDNQNKILDKAGIKKADVVIDFTSPDIVMKNIEEVAKLQKPFVVGTSGWYDKIDTVKKIIAKQNSGLIYGNNFSIGVNIFFHILAYSASLFHKVKAYDVYGLEIHHTGKKDSPSGTAKKITEIILKNFPEKKIVQPEKINRQIKKEELHFVSIRGGRNPGRHEVVFDSAADEINLIQQSHNRQGFAEGAILAARFIQNKKGFYSFDDVIQEIIKTS